MSDAMEIITHEREMAVTHTEFYRLFKKVIHAAVIKDTVIKYHADCSLVETEIGSIKILLGAESVRKIALLSLPMTRVKLEFHGYTESQYATFIRQFNLSFQKGGG